MSSRSPVGGLAEVVGAGGDAVADDALVPTIAHQTGRFRDPPVGDKVAEMFLVGDGVAPLSPFAFSTGHCHRLERKKRSLWRA